jgi:hypothetical protein
VVKLSVGIDQRDFVSDWTRIFCRGNANGGLMPSSLCAVPTGLAEILAVYPGLTPWANFMSPRERGLAVAVETARLWLSSR